MSSDITIIYEAQMSERMTVAKTLFLFAWSQSFIDHGQINCWKTALSTAFCFSVGHDSLTLFASLCWWNVCASNACYFCMKAVLQLPLWSVVVHWSFVYNCHTVAAILGVLSSFGLHCLYFVLLARGPMLLRDTRQIHAVVLFTVETKTEM